jgi:1-acyl-sn-glycerol-3-phosphate acyltransferase
MPFTRFLRSLLLFIYFIVYTIPYATACFIAFPFLNADRRYWMAVGWCRSTVFVVRWLNGIRYRIEGAENLPQGPAVLLSKHQSAWETLAFPAIMPRPLCYVFKRELLYVPFFGWALGMLKMVHIDRKEGTYAFASVVRQGRKRMSEGAWVIMFPEGTRTKVGALGKYKTGGARFAIDSGAPVVPIAHNAGRVWPRNSFIKYPGTVAVSIGKPIASAGLTPDELNTRVEAWIEAEMRRIDPNAYSDAGDANGAGLRAGKPAGARTASDRADPARS